MSAETSPAPKLGILTSGGDAQGMNAAVRSVVRTALNRGVEVYAIYEGYQGMIDGGDGIKRFDWEDVGSILHKGGTIIGTFRSADFRERWGRLKAAANLVNHGIDRLVVIGGDGSLSGLDMFRHEWTGLLDELVSTGQITREQADAHPVLLIAGLVGSIDNDLVGSDMTIGADTALHRILEAVDALASTSASHQRRFVVEVMGRHCGYLGLMSAIAGACDYLLIPENPPAAGWEDRMCEALKRGRELGRRESMVIVAEGAQDRDGNHISAQYVADVIKEKLNDDARVTILGHVQRGGAPSAYDRWASTWLGYRAVEEVLTARPEDEGKVMAIRGNRVQPVPLVEAVERTRQVPAAIEAGEYDKAMALRGGSFTEMTRIFAELNEPAWLLNPHEPLDPPRRVAILHAGGLAPGMNTAAEVAVRLGINRGYTMLGVRNGFVGLREGELQELSWGDVEGWMSEGGAFLGTHREEPKVEHLYSMGRTLEEFKVDALLVVGGFNAYSGALMLSHERERYPAFNIPIVCVPASIDNNLPGSELSIGTDSALNVIVEALDKVKQSGSASNRCFVVETMGRQCGYLAMVGGLASGAERIYTHEEGITLEDLVADVKWMKSSFEKRRRLFLAVRGEDANKHYTTNFLTRMFEEGGGDLYDVRDVVLGHIQQGGNPSPFDRLLATRLISRAIKLIDEQFANPPKGTAHSYYIGLNNEGITHERLSHFDENVDRSVRRPIDQWWLQLAPIVNATARRPGEKGEDFLEAKGQELEEKAQQ